MAPITRIFWMAFLLIFTTGCSSYKMVSTPQVAGEQALAGYNLDSLENGDEVRVTLWYEGVVEGKIVESSPEGISMRLSNNELGELQNLDFSTSPMNQGGQKSNNELGGPKDFDFEQIKSLEKRSFSIGKSLGLFACIAVPIAALGIAIGASGGMSVNMPGN